MTDASDREHLSALRRRHRDAPTTWLLNRTGASLLAVIAERTPPAKILTLTDDCTFEAREFLLHVHEDMGLLLRLFDKACAIIRQLPPADRQIETESNAPKPNYAAECAMKCCEPRFLAFLREERDIDTADAERLNTGVRSLLKVQSRNDLNTDPNAAARWQSLKASFELWSRT